MAKIAKKAVVAYSKRQVLSKHLVLHISPCDTQVNLPKKVYSDIRSLVPSLHPLLRYKIDSDISKQLTATKNILYKEMSLYSIDTVEVNGVNVFYRYAGNETAPVILLLHGFPSSSTMFRHLIPLLAMTYFVIAPDFPGFGFTQVPAENNYIYNFANLAQTIEGFVDVLQLDRFSMYIFDYGAPVGLRLALSRPQAVAAIFSQNGNAYSEGLGDAWGLTKQYWSTGSEADRDALRPFLTLEKTMSQYITGSPHPAKIQPESYYLDQALLDRAGVKEIQLDLIYDYRTNVELYPKFQEYFRDSGVPVLAVWGKNDEFFVPLGAEAFARDVKTFELHFLDAGHFALETNEVAMAGYIDGFIKENHIY